MEDEKKKELEPLDGEAYEDTLEDSQEDSEEELLKKRRARLMVKQYLTIMHEEAKKANLERDDKRHKLEIKKLLDKAQVDISDRAIDEILEEYEVLDSQDFDPDYLSSLETIEKGDTYQNDSKQAAKDILDIAYGKSKLDDVTKRLLKDSFDVLCLDRLKKVYVADNKINDSSKTDAQLLELIHNSKEYLSHFKHPDQLDADFAKKVLDDRLENTVVKEVGEELTKLNDNQHKSKKVAKPEAKPSKAVVPHN